MVDDVAQLHNVRVIHLQGMPLSWFENQTGRLSGLYSKSRAFSGARSSVLDTCVMQRLRRLRQLAYANLLYPGAVHTRFDHSIGVFHIAGQLADRVIADKHERRVVRLAALIHDVGHGPFSHVSETLLERFGRNMESEPASSHQIHEEITIQLIEDGEIAETLGSTIMEVFYNRLRLHSALGYLSPENYQRRRARLDARTKAAA